MQSRQSLIETRVTLDCWNLTIKPTITVGNGRRAWRRTEAMMAQHQEEADYVGQRRTSLEVTRLSFRPGPPSLMYFPSCSRGFRGFIILEEGLSVCRPIALQSVPMVSIQVPVEVPSIQQIFPHSLLPWKAPERGGSVWDHGKSPGALFFTRF